MYTTEEAAPVSSVGHKPWETSNLKTVATNASRVITDSHVHTYVHTYIHTSGTRGVRMVTKHFKYVAVSFFLGSGLVVERTHKQNSTLWPNPHTWDKAFESSH